MAAIQSMILDSIKYSIKYTHFAPDSFQGHAAHSETYIPIQITLPNENTAKMIALSKSNITME